MKDYDYSKLAENYDVLENHESIAAFNEVLDKILNKFNIKSIWDMTCGTGLQTIHLHNKGYNVTASDYSKDMLAVAQKKYPNIAFKHGDMRSANFGKFDAAISIFNAIGHLSKKDFEKTLKNIHVSLNQGGIYIFDIFNLDYMRKNFIKYEFVDVAKEVDDTKYVRFNHNKFNIKKGVMTIGQRTYIQKGIDKPQLVKDEWDLQIYSSDQLKQILEKNGFEVVEFLKMDGNKFDKEKSSFVLTVAKKQ